MVTLAAVAILIGSLVYVLGQVPKVRAQRVSCDAFGTHYLAQKYYDEQAVLKMRGQPYDASYARLDGDNDGTACESKV